MSTTPEAPGPGPKPFVTWVQVHWWGIDGPTSFTLTGDGVLTGRWPDGYSRPLVEDDMYFYGFQKCYCCPPIDHVDPDCPAHGGDPR